MAPSFILGSPFQDHAVLQRDTAQPIWGWGRPGQRVSLEIRGPKHATLTALADEAGRFELSCPPLPAGGPYELCFTGSSELSVRDVLFGEVFIAAGQSNMEFPLLRVVDAEFELSDAELPQVRVLKVAPHAARKPQRFCQGEWAVASADSAARFTAVGFCFARELHRRLQVPFGIIDTSFGGTTIDAWMSERSLGEVDPTVGARLRALDEDDCRIEQIRADYQQLLSTWEHASFPKDPPNLGLERGYADPNFDDSDWPLMPIPSFWQDHGLRFNGVLWFRKTFDVPHTLVDRELELCLGAIDDFDHTYLNGQLVGSLPDGTPNAFQTTRRYRVPRGLVRPGPNVLAVRVFDHFGEGGFAGPERALYLHAPGAPVARLALAGQFRYSVEHEVELVPGSVYANYPQPPLVLAKQNAPAHLFNAMLAPFSGLPVRGVLFYQGESDVATHSSYAARLRGLVTDFRTLTRVPRLPFHFVQLAGYRADANWPLLRQAQASVCHEPDIAMVTAIDLGEPDDIHPKNKQEVARRLALLARAYLYAEPNVQVAGPELVRATANGSSVRLEFDHASGLRSRTGQAPRGFEIAGVDGTRHPAIARIEANCVHLTAPQVRDPAVAFHAFSDCPDVDLENAAALPALPFRVQLG